MEISRRLWHTLYGIFDDNGELEMLPSSPDDSVYYHATASDIILWCHDEKFYIEDGEDFRNV